MVLAVVDDLMFSSKIRAVAERTGSAIRFARSKDAALADARASAPALVIVDLDRDPIDPIGTVAAFKADPALRGIRLVGYVSHVHAARIADARAAGCDTVLARSAFVNALPVLLAGGGPEPQQP
jgi:PleD family two-component response regulator